jgi:hypothetical protein
MPTPDSIDKGASGYMPNNSGAPAEVWVDPATGRVFLPTNDASAAILLAQGFTPKKIARDQFAAFKAAMGGMYQVFDSGMATPGAPAYTPEATDPTAAKAMQDALDAVKGQNDAAQANVAAALAISQPGRDRAAKQLKEAYTGSVEPTLLASAFSGAGYNQANQKLLEGATTRDYNLANVADQNTSAQFQASAQADNLRAQAAANMATIRDQAVKDEQARQQAAAKRALDLISNYAGL